MPLLSEISFINKFELNSDIMNELIYNQHKNSQV